MNVNILLKKMLWAPCAIFVRKYRGKAIALRQFILCTNENPCVMAGQRFQQLVIIEEAAVEILLFLQLKCIFISFKM